MELRQMSRFVKPFPSDPLIPFISENVYRTSTVCQALCWGIGKYDRFMTLGEFTD